MENPVESFFNPKSIAVVGATEKAGIGRSCFSNVINETAYKGVVYAINPTRKEVMGIPSFPSLDTCPTVPELVLIVTPAKTVPDLVGQCVDLGVKGVIVISSGFKEIGPSGAALEEQIAVHLRRGQGRTRLVGPNCFGVLNPPTHINTTFALNPCGPGHSAIISQSGAFATCLMDWAMKVGFGFSSLVTVGSMLDVSWPDLFAHFEADEHTRSVMVYAETLGDARGFLESARKLSLKKPIILLKPGRTEAAAKAAVSHTGSLAGSDDVVDAALDRAGVIRVNSVNELFQLMEMVTFAPIPRGPRMAIISHAGGPGVMAADALCAAGCELSTVPAKAIASLDPHLPTFWSRGNPYDLTGGASPEMYTKVMDEVGAQDHVDGVLIFVGPLAMCPSTPVAAAIKSFVKRHPDKTVVGCFLGGDDSEGARVTLRRAGIPVYLFTDDAVRSYAAAYKYRTHVAELNAAVKPAPLRAAERLAAEKAVNELINRVRSTGRTILTEAESKELLGLYNIPVSETVPCPTVEAAVAAAERIGFPVVVKLLSETITHKSDVGGVMLNINSVEAVRTAFEQIRANLAKVHPDSWKTHFGGVTVQPMLDTNSGYEVLLGANTDAQFGPVVVFGTGGKLVEVYRDRALAIPPLTRPLARQVMEKTKIFRALKGVRGQGPADMDKLEQIVCDFGDLIARHPAIKELDVNPLFVSEKRICAIDGRVVLWPADCAMSSIPRAAILPYPLQYVKQEGAVEIRPLRPEDAEMWRVWKKSVGVAEPSDSARIDELHNEYNAQLTIGAIQDGVLKGTATLARKESAECQLSGKGVATLKLNHLAPSSDLATLLLKHSRDIAKHEGYTQVVDL